MASSHSVVGSARLDLHDRGQQLHEVARRGMVEAHRAADRVVGRAARAVAQDLVAVADLLALEVQDVGRRHARLAA